MERNPKLILAFVASVIVMVLIGVYISGLSLAPTDSSATAPVVDPDTPQIRVREAGTAYEFYNINTNAKFIPRGNNYIRLANQADTLNGGNIFYHSTFDPLVYEAERAESALTKMQADGYNTVRIFVNDNHVGNSRDGGLSSTYLTNLSDFIKRARAHDIYVLLTLVWIPKEGGYYTPVSEPAKIDGMNWMYMSPDALAAKKRYIQDLVAGLEAYATPFSHIFAISLENEFHFAENYPPVNLGSGSITPANGQTYDMSTSGAQRKIMNESMVYWINQVANTVRQEMPGVLVTTGFFSPQTVAGSDPRVISVRSAMLDLANGGTSLDFIDLHIYPPAQGLTMQQISMEFEIPPILTKPLIVGEFSMYKQVEPDVIKATNVLKDLQKVTCNSQIFQGWLLWTWDAGEGSMSELYNALDNLGALNGQLAPTARPNPCQ